MTWGSMLVTEEQWRRLPFEMEYKVSCLCAGGVPDVRARWVVPRLLWENEACMQGLYKPRAGHTSETAVNRVNSVSSVAFWSQEHGTPRSHLTPFQFNYTVSHFHTLTLSLLVSPPDFTLHYYSSLLQHTTPLPLQHLTSPPRPLLFICLSRKWWWVANLTWFPLTLTSRVAGPAATSGLDLRFSQGGLEMGLAGLVGLGALMQPHVPGLEEGWGRTPTNSNMKALLKNADLVRAPSFHLRNRSK